MLREICRHIAADELRHYRLFYKNLDRYLAQDRIGRLGRLRIALGRVAESEDDELAYAYYAANETGRPTTAAAATGPMHGAPMRFTGRTTSSAASRCC